MYVWMDVCVYVCMYYVCVYTYIFYVYIYIHIHTYVYVYIYMYRSAQAEDKITGHVCAHRSSPLSHVVFAGSRGQHPAPLVSL